MTKRERAAVTVDLAQSQLREHERRLAETLAVALRDKATGDYTDALNRTEAHQTVGAYWVLRQILCKTDQP